jgi:hypothetical protein
MPVAWATSGHGLDQGRPILLLGVDGVLDTPSHHLPDGGGGTGANGDMLSWDPTVTARLWKLHESSRVEDELDNGLALCSLHHKLFDRGVFGLDDDLTVVVSLRGSA